ncbi:MAG: autotransporter outer membrane beta-barrel domain-containing protein [Rhizobiales bacterium]|nr:autotransporter outer membrane beta-barrel domain-containing protein [Hyphomicrobiales bacterium]
MGGGIWVRGVGGRLDTDARATVSTTGPVGAPFNGITLDANTRSTFGGFQVGADSGALNIWNSGWNMHFGLTAGYLSSEIRDRNGPGGMNFEIPFIGAYAAFVHSSGFFADVMVRGDFYTMNATNPLVGIVDRSFDGKGISVTSSAGYRFDLPNGFFIEPSAGLILSQVRVDNLVVDGPGPFGVPPGTVSFNTVKSLLGRAGARIGTTWTSGSLVISPFLAASVWHEFEDANQSTYVCNGCAFSMDVATSRIGTYGQYSAGASAAFGNTGWLGYVRFDYRNGQNVDGWTLGGGLRYQFDTGAVVAARY